MQTTFGVPPSLWSDADKAAAVEMNLTMVPQSAAATALTAVLTDAVIAWEANTGSRGNARRATGQDKLRSALGATVGALLSAWSANKPRATFHRLEPAAFTGGPVPHRQFQAAMAGIVALGYAGHSDGIRYALDWHDGPSSHGKTARFRPAPRLLDLAEQHGIGPGTVWEAFGAVYPTTAPTVTELVDLYGLAPPRRAGINGRRERPKLAIAADDATAQRLIHQVATANDHAASHDVRGCLPPRWRRVFTLDWTMGGRWVSVGPSGRYQTLPKAERAKITIDGRPTVELDITAAHLTMMHGLLGLELPDGDPYAVGDLPRDVAKTWVSAALGKGSPVVEWSFRAEVDAAAWPAERVGTALLARYPFLVSPAKAVPELAQLGNPRRLLTHRLMGLEAAAVTLAMGTLRTAGVLALPIHDAVLVPAAHADLARHALVDGFAQVAGIRPNVKATGPA